MEKKHHDLLKKSLLYALLLIVSYLLQAIVFPWLPIFGAKPLVLPAAVCAIAIHEGMLRGGAFGLAAGVLCDAALNQPTILFTLLLMAVGVGVGFLSDRILSRGFPSCLLCTVLTLLLCTFLQILQPVFFGGASVFVALWVGLLQVLYSLLFAVPAYLAARSISRSARI